MAADKTGLDRFKNLTDEEIDAGITADPDAAPPLDDEWFRRAKHVDPTEYECPHCKADLRGIEIPEDHRHLYGHKTHFLRRLAIYDLEKDRTVAFRCPDCGGEWSR